MGVGCLCHLFRFVKRKHLFMKVDMTRNINTLRSKVKTMITKMGGAIV